MREALRVSPSWSLRTRIAADVCEGLAYLHAQGVIHRDVKTPNILLDDLWNAKLCDYSFAIHSRSPALMQYTCGTDEFMAPEVALGEDYGEASDVFSLGIVLCELITLVRKDGSISRERERERERGTRTRHAVTDKKQIIYRERKRECVCV